MNVILNIIQKFRPIKKILNMSCDEVTKELYVVAAGHGNVLFQNSKFRKLTNYNNQNQTTKDAYFNELVASFLVMIKLQLIDYKHLSADKEKIEYIVNSLYKTYFKYLKNIGISKKYVNFWKKFLSIKEKNIVDIKNSFKNLEDEKLVLLCEKMIDYPEFLIINSTTFDTLHYFSKKKRAGENNKDFMKMLTTEHTNLFIIVKKMLEE